MPRPRLPHGIRNPIPLPLFQSDGLQSRAAVHAPAAREVPALFRPGGVDAAGSGSLQEFAGSVRRLFQGQLGPIAGQHGVAIDEFLLPHSQRGGRRGDVRRLQQHRAGPPAAGPATQAGKCGHGGRTGPHGYCMYMRSPPGPMMIGFRSSCSSQATLMFFSHASARARWKTR